MGRPRQRRTAIHITSSSVCNPREDSGSAFNHAPVSWQKRPKVVRDIWCQMHFQGDDHMWLVPVVCLILSDLCLMVEQEKLSLGFHFMPTSLPQLQDKE